MHPAIDKHSHEEKRPRATTFNVILGLPPGTPTQSKANASALRDAAALDGATNAMGQSRVTPLASSVEPSTFALPARAESGTGATEASEGGDSSTQEPSSHF